jgi:hypothetical protein
MVLFRDGVKRLRCVARTPAYQSACCAAGFGLVSRCHVLQFMLSKLDRSTDACLMLCHAVSCCVLCPQSLKTYKTGRYVQSAAVSPIFDHILLGGGQDAAQVGALLCGG